MVIGLWNSSVMKQRLDDQRVLIILDDEESLFPLEALVDITWFGPGSRVIVTIEKQKILEQHGINDIYQVGFPSEREALKIFCLSAFRQTFPPNVFIALADEVASNCGNLPLGLHVLGTSLRGKSQADWIDKLPRLENCLDARTESVVKVEDDEEGQRGMNLNLQKRQATKMRISSVNTNPYQGSV
ncbi:predicted protein [Arabidopsis lyrata subsp. lyrata]|uniref:Predicted protein n=1 Tax=Arabidopsis lyrata subsp. lyrata TaxID=81972 RepID=D7KB33_ARALL|nr:predicted protein [Arabidopsis lyrata subsp. lyrata]